MRKLGHVRLFGAALALALLATGCGGGDDGGNGDGDGADMGAAGGGGSPQGGDNQGGDQPEGGDDGPQGGDGGGGEGGGPAGGEGGEGLPLGAGCELPPICRGTPEDEPGCCNFDMNDPEVCTTGGCQRGTCATRFSERRGVCTRECERDSACENFTDGPYGAEWRCLHDDTSGECVPGSNERCDGPANGACPDGEICTFGQTYSPDAPYGGLCQPPHEGGLAVGEACDEAEGRFCANGMCIAGKCSTFCDPDAAESPCAGGFECFNDFSLAEGRILIDICLPKYCEKNADCGADEVCGITLDFGGNPLIVGICVPSDPNLPKVGDNCGNNDFCDGGNLCIGENSEYCSAFCDSDADCPNGACTVTSLLLDEATMQTAPIQLCVPAPVGTGRDCETNADCAAEGENPEEACSLILRGVVTEGREVEAPHVAGRCIGIPEGAVAPGEACDAANPCRTEDLCLDGFCSQLCRTTADCGEGSLCGSALVDSGATPAFSDDSYTGLCVADAGSHASCESDADCMPGTEFCIVNVLLHGEQPVLEQFCSAKVGTGETTAGAECANNEACLSGRCNAWSRRVADPGYCFGLCENDAQCSEDGSSTCESYLAFSGDEGPEDDIHVNACIPVHVCGACDFGAGTRPCGGETTCSLVTFPESGRRGGACLEACDNGACPDGFACRPAVGEDGEELEGLMLCAPAEPEETCASAKPLR